MQDLRITLIQSRVHWHQPDANLAMFEEKIWEIGEETDLIILPEMFTTGFTMESAKLAEPPNSKTYRWMAQMAAQTKAMITGSYIVKETAGYFNRLLAVDPKGASYHYDKRHLFRMANEQNHYSPGKERLILTWKGWRVLPLVCYDLRFPVWSRNKKMENDPLEYDLLLYVANWPATRVSAWDALLKARGIENLSYSVGVNRVGPDDNGIEYNGHSAVYDPKGNSMLYLDEIEEIKTVKLSAQELGDYREKFPAYLDRDDFEIK